MDVSETEKDSSAAIPEGVLLRKMYVVQLPRDSAFDQSLFAYAENAFDL